jgi:hypothetical protein
VDRIEQAPHAQRRHGTPAAVVYCDLDAFKQINDTQGHAAEDAALVRAAEALRRAVRPGDTVARMGGDEFVVLCPGIGTAAEAEDLVGRIDAVLAADGGTLRRAAGRRCPTGRLRPDDPPAGRRGDVRGQARPSLTPVRRSPPHRGRWEHGPDGHGRSTATG